MRFKLLGRTGLKVSELCLGTMTFGTDWGWGADKKESKKIFEAFVKAGGNFIDTANVYTGGTSEKFLGEFLSNDRDRFVLATKYTSNLRPDDPNAGGNHRKSLMQNLENSLKRLQTDYIDLLWIHSWDKLTPVDEVMRALDDAVRAGKVLYVGASDAPAWYVSTANTMADARGWTTFSAIQVEYNLVQRTPERELLPMASALDLAVIAWSPLGGGYLTGKYLKKKKPEDSRFAHGPWGERYFKDRNEQIAGSVAKIAKESGRSAAQVSIRWLMQRTGNVVIPIIGARTLAQARDDMGALDFSLDDEQMDALDKISAVELGFPHDFLNTPRIRAIVNGSNWDKIDDHRKSG